MKNNVKVSYIIGLSCIVAITQTSYAGADHPSNLRQRAVHKTSAPPSAFPGDETNALVSWCSVSPGVQGDTWQDYDKRGTERARVKLTVNEVD